MSADRGILEPVETDGRPVWADALLLGLLVLPCIALVVQLMGCGR